LDGGNSQDEKQQHRTATQHAVPSCRLTEIRTPAPGVVKRDPDAWGVLSHARSSVMPRREDYTFGKGPGPPHPSPTHTYSHVPVAVHPQTTTLHSRTQSLCALLCTVLQSTWLLTTAQTRHPPSAIALDGQSTASGSNASPRTRTSRNHFRTISHPPSTCARSRHVYRRLSLYSVWLRLSSRRIAPHARAVVHRLFVPELVAGNTNSSNRLRFFGCPRYGSLRRSWIANA
jgi:hypothetical protein